MYVVVRSDGNAIYCDDINDVFLRSRPFVDHIYISDHYIMLLAHKILEALK